MQVECTIFEVTYIKWPFFWFVLLLKYIQCVTMIRIQNVTQSFEISLFINNSTTLKRKPKEPNSISHKVNGKKVAVIKVCTGPKYYKEIIIRHLKEEGKKHNIESQSNVALALSIVMHKSNFIFFKVSAIKNIGLDYLTISVIFDNLLFEHHICHKRYF